MVLPWCVKSTTNLRFRQRLPFSINYSANVPKAVTSLNWKGHRNHSEVFFTYQDFSRIDSNSDEPLGIILLNGTGTNFVTRIENIIYRGLKRGQRPSFVPPQKG